MRRLVLLLTLVLTISACGGSLSSYPYAKEPDPRKSEYVIGVSDGLRIRVWKNPELNTDIQVRPDGTITMPLIGDVHADGLTPTKLRAEIQKRLSVYIRDQGATVTVAVGEVNSYNITVSGNVTQPGVFNARHYLTVADAIALAGGPNRFANASETVILRKGPNGSLRRIPIDYAELAKGNKQEQNLVLLKDDTILVP